ncbi:MAG: helix-turn-helix transcriptional regulator [Alphaproteobacteria bacterium]|nr:helix-turn-helix transcriptional regulator [Alphaproteobacteria bacterium]
MAKALDVLGGRWTLLIVRDLLPGPRRYSDLLDALPGITTNLLADRLRELVSAGLIEKRTLPAPAGSAVYALTPRGQALEDVILALGRFGEQYLVAPGDDRVDFRWFAVSLRRRFRSDDPRPFRVQLEQGGVAVHAWWDGRSLHTRDGVEHADVSIRGDRVAMALLGRAPLHSVGVEGDQAVLERFVAGLTPRGT